jgi:hypothetical protein
MNLRCMKNNGNSSEGDFMTKRICGVVLMMVLPVTLQVSGETSDANAMCASVLKSEPLKLENIVATNGWMKDQEFLECLLSCWEKGTNETQQRVLLSLASRHRHSVRYIVGKYASYPIVTNVNVGAALAKAYDKSLVGDRAAYSLCYQTDEEIVHGLAGQLLETAKRRGKDLDSIDLLLLGRTGSAKVREFLESSTNMGFTNSVEWAMALAKLGGEWHEEWLIEQYLLEIDDDKKAVWARRLGYVGNTRTCTTLAKDLRIEKRYADGSRDMRLAIIDGLWMAFRDETVLQLPKLRSQWPKDDTFYEAVEKWAETKFNIKWERPRPPFFYEEFRVREGKPDAPRE